MKKCKLHIFTYLYLGIILLFTLFPLLYTFFASFKSNAEILANAATIIPKKFVLDNYVIAWKTANLGRYTLNSVIYAGVLMIFTVVFSAMGGYVFALGKFPGKRIIFIFLSATMFLNFGSLTVYPLLTIANSMHLSSSIWGLTIIKIFGVQIFNMYLVKGYVHSIPKELLEASEIDGCSFKKAFFVIFMPLLKPIMATVAITSFQCSWNDYLLPMIFTLSSPNSMTLVVGIDALKSTGEAATNWNLMLAGSMLSIIPVLILYILASKYYISGLTRGAVKY